MDKLTTRPVRSSSSAHSARPGALPGRLRIHSRAIPQPVTRSLTRPVAPPQLRPSRAQLATKQSHQRRNFFARRPLLRSTLALSLVSMVNRIIGMLYRALLARTAGAEALGLYELTTPWRRITSLASTLELPIALSQVVATAAARPDHARARAAARFTLQVLLWATLLASLGLWAFLSLNGGRFLADRRAQLALEMYPLVLLPAVLASWTRAFLQGYQSMVPTAFAQLAEQFARVPAVLLLVSLFLPFGSPRVAQAIMLGAAAGELADLLVLWLLIRRRRAGLPEGVLPPAPWASAAISAAISTGPSPSAPPASSPHPSPAAAAGLRRELFRVALPLVGAQIYASLFQIAYLALLPRRLALAGIGNASFTAFYGQMTGMVFPVLYFPMVLIHPLVRVLLPATADAWEKGATWRLRRLLNVSLLTSLVLGVGVVIAATSFAEPLVTLLYGREQAGAARVMALLAWATPLVFIYHIFMAVLNGLGRTASALAILIASSLVRVGIAAWLAADPAWGLDGIIVAIIADDAVSVLMAALAVAANLRRLPRSSARSAPARSASTGA